MHKKSLIKMSRQILACDPAEARTQDPQIKSLLLYQLSYGVMVLQINEFPDLKQH